MKTDKQLLQEYTEIINAEWNQRLQKDEIRAQLDSNAKDHTNRLKTQLRKIVKGTKWTIEDAGYYVMIGHATRPVTGTLQANIVLYRFSEKPKSLAKFDITLSPETEDEILEMIKAIVTAAP